MSRTRFTAFVIIVLIVAGMFVLAAKRSHRKETRTTTQIQEERGIPVETAEVRLGRIDDTAPVTGSVAALDSVTLSAKMMTRVASVIVREGDPVRRGQVVIRLDQSDAKDNLRQALAGLQAAQARLSQAQTGADVTAVQSSAGIEQAKAGLAAAEANMEKIRKGARSQERMMAENQVATAKAGLDYAAANLRRYKALFTQGAIAQANLEVAQTQYDVAVAQYNSAKENLSLVEEGARSEDVRAAETMVTQAKEALRTAKANAAQDALRQEDIKAALAGVAQAEAQVGLAREQIDNTLIRSSIDGTVAQRSVEVGQLATPGVPLMQVVNVRTVYFQADVSETIIRRVKAGQNVNVTVDAFPDGMFAGKVQRIYPAASTASRSFTVRVHVPNPDSRLRPGMFARGSIVIGGDGQALLVPRDAVEERNGQNVVLTVNSSTAKLHKIKTGLANPEFVEVLPPTDLAPGDAVVTSGREYLQDGSKVLRRG